MKEISAHFDWFERPNTFFMFNKFCFKFAAIIYPKNFFPKNVVFFLSLYLIQSNFIDSQSRPRESTLWKGFVWTKNSHLCWRSLVFVVNIILTIVIIIIRNERVKKKTQPYPNARKHCDYVCGKIHIGIKCSTKTIRFLCASLLPSYLCSLEWSSKFKNSSTLLL